jgi:hypothetical protein
MPKYVVRTNCEYSIAVIVPEGATGDDAIEKANKTDVADWDQAWAEPEAEPA